MKAIICTGYGPPEVLKLAEVEKPVPRDNEIRIRVRATAVTASDCIVRGFRIPRWHPTGFMMGLVLGFKKPRNPILGIVLSGVVDAAGKKVSSFHMGDEVMAWTVGSAVQIRFGSYAEYNCLPDNYVIALKPVNMGYEEAAALPYGGLIAMHYLKKGDIRNGQKVLIYGASGSIGTAAVQVAKHFGAEVTGVCSTTNIEMVRSLGADQMIDYTKENALKADIRYDFILDAVGRWKSSQLKMQCKNALTPNGTYISVDDGSPRATKENLNLLRDLAEKGKFRPVIDRTYLLEEMVEAHRYVDQGHKKGNVIIAV